GGNTDVCLDAIGPPTGEVRAAFAPSPGGSVESLPRIEGDLRSPDGDHVGAVVPGNGSLLELRSKVHHRSRRTAAALVPAAGAGGLPPDLRALHRRTRTGLGACGVR